MKKNSNSQSGTTIARFSLALMLGVAGMSLSVLAFSPPLSHGPLSLQQRVADQRAIEEVRWRHREWPANNPLPKPPLSKVLPEAALRAKVMETLRMSNALDLLWHEKLTGERLQAEINRMVRSTKQPQVLAELFQALGNDPHRIAESLARPLLAARLLRNVYSEGGANSFATHWPVIRETVPTQMAEPVYSYETPAVTTSGCTDDSWRPTPGIPERVLHTAVWTGSEMLIWGGELDEHDPRVTNTGHRYDPATDTWRDMTTAGAPAARQAHSAIWTGTEMIIFGGAQRYDSPAYYNDVSRYNPATDTWTTGSSNGGPSQRQHHTAVWTGTEMIVWGGSELTCAVPGQCVPVGANMGARYNPTTDQWRSMSLLMAPSARVNHTAIWSGTEMIVWGGESRGSYVGDGGRYDPASDSWKSVTTTNSPVARSYHSAVWTNREMIIWGGYDNNELNDGARYNPVSDTWTAANLSGAPEKRDTHTAVWTGTQMVVWGGVDGSQSLKNGGLYDPATDSWQSTDEGGAPSPRSEHTAVWTGSEMIVFGGILSPADPLASGGRYDPVQNRWRPTSTRGAPAARRNHSAVWTGVEMIIWGGVAPEFGGNTNDGARYEPATDSWSPISLVGAPAARSEHAAIWSGAEMIVWGGTGSGLGGGSGLFGSGGRYNPAANTWAPTSQLNAPASRSLFSAVWSGSEMIVWGGYVCNNPPTCDQVLYTNSGGRYNPSTDTWLATDLNSAPAGRVTHIAVWAGNEMIVWGGFGCSAGACDSMNATQLNTGGRYRPASDTWLPTPTAGAPVARDLFSAVWTGKEMIVWGGGNEAPPYFNTGGRYDPAKDSWTLTSTTGAPSGRNVPTAVWTGQEMIIWGGYDDSVLPTNTGGRYDPKIDNWRPTTTTGAPPGRDSHTAIWTGNEMIVWGGEFFFPSSVGGRYCAAVSVPPVQLNAVVSRKTHGSAGTFDVDLTSGNGIECRSGGTNGDYTMVFTFTNTLGSVSSASVTSGTGAVVSGSIDSSDAHNYIVNLTGVGNAQVITVSLSNVADSAGNYSNAVSASMGVLLGDTNSDTFVNSADIGQTKSQSGQPVTNANFREDVNVDGFLNSADIGLVKSKSATALP